MRHSETGVSQEPLELRVLYPVFVHNGCGGEPQLLGGTVFNAESFAALF